MSSILTNTSAMVALQTLRGINSSLSKTQDEISTGKSIATARDNSAVWAISKVMESDVKGFKAISDSLSLGQSTITVARNAAESVTDLLTEIKGKIVAAQEQNVDRAKIQTDIGALRDQIGSIVDAAQFNGLNLLSNTSTTAGSGTVSVLSSLDRDAAGNVTASYIDVAKRDLSGAAQAVDSGGTYAAGTGGAAGTLNATQSVNLTVASVTAGTAYSIGLTGTDADSSSFVPGTYTTSGDVAGASLITYVARDGDTAADVAQGLASAYATYAAENGLDTGVLNFSANGSNLVATSGATDGTDTIAVRIDTVTGDNTIGGGLGALAGIDVSTDAGAASALAAVEGLIQTAIDASAEFGSAQGRIDIQSDFVSKLTDSLKAGIGTLVDADMEEASARLQALQVQQQLGIQSLSIANQQPQSILSLFR
jgi:flagellin